MFFSVWRCDDCLSDLDTSLCYSNCAIHPSSFSLLYDIVRLNEYKIQSTCMLTIRKNTISYSLCRHISFYSTENTSLQMWHFFFCFDGLLWTNNDVRLVLLHVGDHDLPLQTSSAVQNWLQSQQITFWDTPKTFANSLCAVFLSRRPVVRQSIDSCESWRSPVAQKLFANRIPMKLTLCKIHNRIQDFQSSVGFFCPIYPIIPQVLHIDKRKWYFS